DPAGVAAIGTGLDRAGRIERAGRRGGLRAAARPDGDRTAAGSDRPETALDVATPMAADAVDPGHQCAEAAGPGRLLLVLDAALRPVRLLRALLDLDQVAGARRLDLADDGDLGVVGVTAPLGLEVQPEHRAGAQRLVPHLFACGHCVANLLRQLAPQHRLAFPHPEQLPDLLFQPAHQALPDPFLVGRVGEESAVPPGPPVVSRQFRQRRQDLLRDLRTRPGVVQHGAFQGCRDTPASQLEAPAGTIFLAVGFGGSDARFARVAGRGP